VQDCCDGVDHKPCVFELDPSPLLQPVDNGCPLSHPDEIHGHTGIEQETDEEFLVVVADAVGDPRAVMVEFEYATFADGTVVGAVGFERGAELTLPFLLGQKSLNEILRT